MRCGPTDFFSRKYVSRTGSPWEISARKQRQNYRSCVFSTWFFDDLGGKLGDFLSSLHPAKPWFLMTLTAFFKVFPSGGRSLRRGLRSNNKHQNISRNHPKMFPKWSPNEEKTAIEKAIAFLISFSPKMVPCSLKVAFRVSETLVWSTPPDPADPLRSTGNDVVNCSSDPTFHTRRGPGWRQLTNSIKLKKGVG